MIPGGGAPFFLPELKALRELRFTLARGGLAQSVSRTAEGWARFTAFTTIAALLRFLNEFQRRIENSECCRIVEVEHPPQVGRLHIEFIIETMPDG